MSCTLVQDRIALRTERNLSLYSLRTASRVFACLAEFSMNGTCTVLEDEFLIRKKKVTAGVEDDLESRGFKFEMTKRSSSMSPKLCFSFTFHLETDAYLS